MLTSIAENLWSIQYQFFVSGVSVTSRMTIIRLPSGEIFLHSPVKLSPEDQLAIDALGEVKWIVAPNRLHHLFAGDVAALYPQAILYGVKGLAKKRPDLVDMKMLPDSPGPWSPDLSYLNFEGIPYANESEWFHVPSGTLIMTDVCQWWRGAIGWKAVLWNILVGVRFQFDVPRSVRRLVRDREAARASAEAILQWPIQRIVLAHNTIIEEDAKKKLTHAFRHFL